VKAEDILLFGEQTKVSGNYEVRINGGVPQKYAAKCTGGNMRLVQVIAEGLEPGKEHEIEITPQLNPGEELRIESVCLAGGQSIVAF